MLEQFFNDKLILGVINRALQLDGQARDKLGALDNKCIAITLEPRSEAWIFRIRDGCLAFDDTVSARDCDVRLSGTFAGFLRLFKQNAPQRQDGERLYIEGDLHTAQTFQRVMASLSPDFDTILRQRFGERLGGFLNEALEQVRRFGEQGRAQIESKLRDYLADTFVSRSEFSRQSAVLDALEARIEALSARLHARPAQGEKP